MKCMIGADPELWIFDKTAGKIISAHGLFPGTKEEPFKVEHGAIQVDGMAAEYNIDPATNWLQFVFHNISVLHSLRDIIRERHPELNFEFVFSPVADFGAEYIAEQPEEARRLGCTPDFNAWKGGQVNPTPDADIPFRTASGHIHIGWGDDYDVEDPEHIEACCMMAKQLDFYVGGEMAISEAEEGAQRRSLYGKAGAFRPKKYGMEYRTPSNIWLKKPTFMRRVFTLSKQAFSDLIEQYKRYEDYDDSIVKYINEYSYSRLRHNFDPLQSSPYEEDWLQENVTVDTLDILYANIHLKVEGYYPIGLLDPGMGKINLDPAFEAQPWPEVEEDELERLE